MGTSFSGAKTACAKCAGRRLFFILLFISSASSLISLDDNSLIYRNPLHRIFRKAPFC
jgi:hypothetical protein